MKAVIQRVSSAIVKVDGQIVSQIDQGLMTLLGVEKEDTLDETKKIIDKIINLRIIEDSNGKMNLSIIDMKYSHMLISQFTLLADTSKGRRPHFFQAEEPLKAKHIYEEALIYSSKFVKTVSGVFAADMKLEIINDGPVTIYLDSRKN